MAKSPFTIDPHLTGIAIAYKNEDYIADEIAPYETVNKELFEWDEYEVGQMFTPPDDKVGRLSKPNEVTFSSTRKEDSTEDHGLDSPVPQKDVDNADANQDPLGFATEGVMELVKLNREIRLANSVFNSATYPAGLKETLSGSDQWSDVSSKPIKKIKKALDKPLMRPNYILFGQEAWTDFSIHPEIVEAVVGTGAQAGVALEDAVAKLFGVKKVLVGMSFQNTAKQGQTVAFNRLWGKHCSLFYKNPLARLKGSMRPTFMMTARFGTPIGGTIPDPDMGLKGGVRVRAGEFVKEVRLSQHCGYFLEDVVA